MRGNPQDDREWLLKAGSIPACAGEPPVALFCGDRFPVYPRVCGGTDINGAVVVGSLGLSPRVRGNRIGLCLRRLDNGSIPACAGEPDRGSSNNHDSSVYPRVCGGTRIGARWRAADTGLSPRVRGNQATGMHPHKMDGSIPACAGEPRRAGILPRRRRVYPRVCGGTVGAYQVSLPEVGLSPRVRGNLEQGVHWGECPGSIPACAGEPACARCRRRDRPVYPRVCGGTVPVGDSVPIDGGLSPRVRGNLGGIISGGKRHRSIPACAGEPHSSAAPPDWQGVYPRVCGGTHCIIPLSVSVSGLSPRVRGNRPRTGAESPGAGSIPACAGEPHSSISLPSQGGVYPRVCGGTEKNLPLAHPP